MIWVKVGKKEAFSVLGGEKNHTIDDKGRVSIPAKLRADLGTPFILSKGVGERCLFLYTMEEWRVLEDKIRTLALTNPKGRRFERFMVGGSCECTLDKQGRVMIPPPLREYAFLKKDVVIVTLTTRYEIWDADLWKEYNDCDGLEEDMESLGI